jgi:uracil-DNA glycosylase
VSGRNQRYALPELQQWETATTENYVWGDPAAIQAYGRGLDTAGHDLGAIADSLSGIDVGGFWTGTAADAFTDLKRRVTPAVRGLSDLHKDSSTALNTWQQHLGVHQADCAAAGRTSTRPTAGSSSPRWARTRRASAPGCTRTDHTACAWSPVGKDRRMATTEFSVAKPPTGVGLDGVRKAAMRCRACPLWEPATQTVFGKGPADARVVFVGEQPGDVEDRKGEPFVGPAGKLLDRALVDAGIDRDETYVTNAVKHFRFTQSGKRRLHQTPGPEHVAACRPWLDAELALVNPELVVCLGATAAKAMFGPSFRITKQRGQLVPLDQQVSLGGEGSLFDEPEDAAVKSAWIMATTHPSAVLRVPEAGRQDAYDALVADLRTGASVLA